MYALKTNCAKRSSGCHVSNLVQVSSLFGSSQYSDLL